MPDRRTILGLGTVAALTVLSVLLFLSSPMAGRLALSALNSGLEHSENLRVRGDVRFRLWSPGLIVEHPVLDFDDRGTVEAKRLSVSIALLPLLGKRVMFKDILLEEPTAELHLPPSDLSTPANPEEKSENTEPQEVFTGIHLPDLPFRLQADRLWIRGGRISLKRGEAPLASFSDLNLILLRKGNEYCATFETGQGNLILDAQTLDVHSVRARISFGQSIHDPFAIDALTIYMPSTTFIVSGRDIELETLNGRLDLIASMPLSRIREFLPDFPPVSGSILLQATATGPATNPVLTGEAELQEVAIDIGDGEKLDLQTVRLPFTVDRKRATFSGAQFKMGKGDVFLKEGWLNFDEQLHCNWQLRLVDTTLNEILENYTLKNVPYTMDVEGDLGLAGTIDPLEMKGDFDLDVPHMDIRASGWYADDWPRALRILEFLPGGGNGKGTLALYPDRFEIVEATATSANTDTVVKVKNHFGFDGYFDLHYWSDRFDFKEVSPIAEIDIKGKAALDVRIHGIECERIDAEIRSPNLTVAGMNLGRSRFEVLFKDQKLQFRRGRFRHGASSFRGSLSLDFNPATVRLSSRISTKDMDVRDFFEIVDLDRGLGAKLEGSFAAKGRLHGPIGKFSGKIEGQFTDFGFEAFHFDKGRVKASISKNDVSFDTCDFTKDGASFTLSGKLEDWKKYNMSVKSEALRLKTFDFLDPYVHDTDVGAVLSAHAKGDLADPYIQGVVQFDPLPLGDQTYGPSEVHVELTSDQISLDALLFDRRVSTQLNLSFVGEEALNLSFSADDIAFTPLLDPLLGNEIENGRLTAEMNYSGSMDDPLSGDGLFMLHRLSGEYRGMLIESQAPIKARIARGAMSIDPFVLATSGALATLRGRYERSGRFDLLLDGEADLKLAPKLFDSVLAAEGGLICDLQLSMLDGRTDVQGTMGIRRGQFELSSLQGPLEDVEGEVLFSGNRVLFENFRAIYGGGRIEGRGEARIGGDRERTFDRWNLSADVHKISFQIQPGMEPVLSGRLSAVGDDFPFEVGGALTVDSMEYLRSVRWQKALLVDSVRDAFKPRRAREGPNRENDAMHYNVEIKARDSIRIRNNLADLSLSADLLLVGSDNRPALLNTLSSAGGTIYFQQNPFDVKRFVVEFNDREKINPLLDIEGSNRLTYLDDGEEREVTLNLRIAGTLEQPEILLTSNSDLSQTDLVSLLLVGHPSTRTDTMETGGTASAATGLSLISDITGVDEQVRSRFKIDEFRLTTEYNEASTSTGAAIVPRLLVGKRISDNVQINFSTAISDETVDKERSFELKYRWKWLTVQGKWDSDAVKPEGNFGLDLKLNYTH